MTNSKRYQFTSPKAAFRRGLLNAFGVPVLVLCGSFLGFGALVRESGLTLWLGLFSTATGWALPGQIAVVELLSVGASFVVMVSVVALTNARLLPMTVVLMPKLTSSRARRWPLYIAAHWVAVTGWAEMMSNAEKIEPPLRLPYFFGYSMTLWSSTLVSTALGFLAADSLPSIVTLGLVFLNPIYFMLVFAADLRDRMKVYALALGALLGPSLHLLTPDWGLLLAGTLGGSLAFGAERMRRAPAGKPPPGKNQGVTSGGGRAVDE